jgi:hypothetical protein
MMWTDISAWLVTVGVILGWLAVFVGLIDFLGDRLVREQAPLDPLVMPQRPDIVEKAIVPDYALSSHVAPLGLAFYTADSLPQKYRGVAFVGQHGSWDR